MSGSLTDARLIGTCPRDCPWAVSEGLSLEVAPKRRFAGGSEWLPSRDAPPSALVASEPGLVPRHLPRCRAAGDRARRPRPRSVVPALRGGAAPPCLAGARVDPARQPLPPP